MTDAIDLEKAIYYEAIAIQDPDRRAAYLHVTCQHDAELYARVNSLIDADGRAGTFLGDSPLDSLVESLRPPGQPNDSTKGATIGRYRLLEKIGEGGFGVVYMADQLEPIHRRLALKIIKEGMDTKQVVARFEAERQALALMDHPNIARVYDAGATDKGRPFFVMELVRGVPVIEYCDQRSLSTEERLAIFIDLCSGIQHAHQKGIIHRDIKPSNVLVSTDGDRAVPKVIDFGIAKATQGSLTNRTLFTQFRQFIGTPAYMSPEQAQMSSVDVDTRSDIYSLGVLLYELLTGKTPLDSKELLSAGYEDLCRRIREEEAPSPSKRISSLHQEELSTLAKNRRVDPAHFLTMIRGDLDWIVMKAVEKDRARRYVTANALGEDIQRHLNHEPVSAVPASPLYRLRKYVSRHRVAVLTAAVVVCALLIGTVASTIGFWRAVRAQKDTEQARGKLSVQLVATQAAQAKAELNVYVSAMNRAYQAYEDADVPLALMILERYRASREANFEWRCLRWLCETGDALHTLRGHSAAINSIAISIDGIVASGAADGNCLLHDLATYEEIQHWPHSSGLRCLAFSPDGKALAMGDEQGQLTIWQVSPWRKVKTLAVENGDISHVAFSPIDNLLAVLLHRPNRLEIWDWQTDELLMNPPLSPGYSASRLEFSPLGDRLAAAAPGPGFRLWDMTSTTGELWGMISQAHTSITRDVSFSRPSGQQLASSSFLDGVIKVWDVAATRRPKLEQDHVQALSEFRGHRGTVNALEFSPDGSHLGSAGGDNTIRLWPGRPPWNSVQEPAVTLRGHTASVNDIAFSHDGELVVSASSDQTIKIWPGRESPGSNVLLGHNEWVFDVAFSPKGRLLASGAFDGEVCLWNTATQNQVYAAKLHEHEVFRVVFSPDGSLLASCDGIWQSGRGPALDSSRPGKVQLLDVASLTNESITLPNNAAIRAIDFSPDGQSLVIGDYDGWIWRMDVSEKEVRDKAKVGDGIVNGLRYSPDGSLIAVSLSDLKNLRRLTCYNAATLQRISQLDGKSAWRLSFAPVSLGTALLAVPSGNGVEFFDLRAGIKQINRWDSYHLMGQVAYSPDGRTLATSGGDHAVRLWNIESEGEVAKLVGHRGQVTGLVFSHDGKMLASSSEDKSIRIWRTIPGADHTHRSREPVERSRP